MQTKFVTAVFLGFVLIGASACGGGGDGPAPGKPMSSDTAKTYPVELPAGHGLTAGTIDVPAEGIELESGTTISCANKEGCQLTVTERPVIGLSASSTGGQVTVTVDVVALPEPVEPEPVEPEPADTDAELEEERKKRLAAEAALEEEKRKAQQAREEAEQQANLTVRAPALITELGGGDGTWGSADVATGASVEYMPGDKLTFKRPNALPAKGSAPSVPGSWRSASYSGPRGNVGTDTVYLYTNIQAPGSKAFWKEHGESVDPNADTTKVEVSSLGIKEGESLYDADSDKQVSKSGTYDGYSGKFSCDGTGANTDCNIDVSSNGDPSFDGTWMFTASLTAKRSSKYAKQDTEFLYFGIWAFEPTDPADSTNPHEFKWAAGGDADNIENFAELTGTAEFRGGAIGKYALAKVGGRAAKIGTFTATANFTADFGNNTVPGTISGRITDFKEGGADLGSDWHVFLGATASTAANVAATGATGTTHGAIDGDPTTTGAWAATLHGSDNYGDFTDRTEYPLSKYPVADVAGVSGWFNAAAGTNAAIAGAFGAACTTGTMCAK